MTTPDSRCMPTLVIHGGAGTITRASMTPEKEQAYRNGLETSLRAGQRILKHGGSSLDAVVAAVAALEDDPLFNAGRGSVFTSDGRNELDASVMDGRERAAGAVAGVSHIRNPVIAARTVMQQSEHVLLCGAGAEQFAREHGLEMVEPSYFFTEDRWKQLERIRARLPGEGVAKRTVEVDAIDTSATKLGTVGAVALDRQGNLAAATSTGGLANKRYGRIGDSPIIGAGTYADNATAAVSATGTGETFIRAVAAYEVSALMKYKGLPLAQAVTEVATTLVPSLGGRGGLIAVDGRGNVAMKFSTEGMYRGVVRGEGPAETAIYA